mgnify:CR=1 FL=1
MATTISITSEEINAIYSLVDFVETNLDGAETKECLNENVNAIKKVNKLVEKFRKSNLRTICRNELKKHGANTKKNVDKMVLKMQKQETEK